MLRLVAPALFGSILICHAALAQTPAEPITIPNRVVFRVIAANEVDTHHARSGDRVKMRIADAEMLDNGIKIPADSAVEGSVLAAAPYTPNGEARLLLVLHRIRVRKSWLPLHAFLITQGVLRKTVVSNETNNPCYDPFTKRSPQSDVYCDSLGVDEPRATGKGSISSDTPVLRDIELVPNGDPLAGNTLVSRKRDIVIEPGMVFLIRHVTAK